MSAVREGRDGAEGVLRPAHEEVLSALGRALTLVTAVALAGTACTAALHPGSSRPGGTTDRVAPPPPNPARNTAARDDPADRARFECAVTVQRAQDFDPGVSLLKGSLVGAAIGGLAGGAAGAVFGLIGDVPGAAAA